MKSHFEVLGLGLEHRNLGGIQPTTGGLPEEGWMEQGWKGEREGEPRQFSRRN